MGVTAGVSCRSLTKHPDLKKNDICLKSSLSKEGNILACNIDICLSFMILIK